MALPNLGAEFGGGKAEQKNPVGNWLGVKEKEKKQKKNLLGPPITANFARDEVLSFGAKIREAHAVREQTMSWPW